MFEFIVLLLLKRRIEAIAQKKKLSKKYWSNRLILGWFGLELAGIFVGYCLGDFYDFYLAGLAAAVIYVLILFDRLRRTPDNNMNDWINQIGTDSVEPLPKIEIEK